MGCPKHWEQPLGSLSFWSFLGAIFAILRSYSAGCSASTLPQRGSSFSLGITSPFVWGGSWRSGSHSYQEYKAQGCRWQSESWTAAEQMCYGLSSANRRRGCEWRAPAGIGKAVSSLPVTAVNWCCRSYINQGSSYGWREGKILIIVCPTSQETRASDDVEREEKLMIGAGYWDRRWTEAAVVLASERQESSFQYCVHMAWEFQRELRA